MNTTARRRGDVSIELGEDLVALVTIHRPPNNFFDVALIEALAETYAELDAEPGCRAIVLAAEGKNFCAGANLAARPDAPAPPATSPPASGGASPLYREAVRLFAARTPVVAAVQGAAVGGGLGLACAADFRVAAPEARFAANFARLGFHHGFGLSVTLPAIVGPQRALELLLTGRRINGEQAAAIGLADRLVPLERLLAEARALAAEIAACGPLAVRSIRDTMRGHLAEAVRLATDREGREQEQLRTSEDFREGVRADLERRPPRFVGR